MRFLCHWAYSSAASNHYCEKHRIRGVPDHANRVRDAIDLTWGLHLHGVCSAEDMHILDTSQSMSRRAAAPLFRSIVTGSFVMPDLKQSQEPGWRGPDGSISGVSAHVCVAVHQG